jgi:hypothetical protein
MLKLFIEFFFTCHVLKSNFVFHFKYPQKSYIIIGVNICGQSV